jgi:2-amino-4-hydroxy-6-hydroxymethyldihydropteridine diphosphokinase
MKKRNSKAKPDPVGTGEGGRRTPVVLAFGGNLPPDLDAVAANLRRAIDQLRPILGPLRVASFYRSAPVSPPISQAPQPDYLNTAAVAEVIAADLPPDAILAIAKALELAAGRRRGVRFGPRPLDIDLLLYGSLRSDAPELTLPHPRLRERRFVLEPLAEIAPDLAIPPDGRSVRELLAALPPDPGLRRTAY